MRYVEIDGELCVLCIGRDITKRRLAEKALKESEEKFARIFAGSPDGIVIISLADSRILDINDAFVGVVGLQLRRNRRASRQRICRCSTTSQAADSARPRFVRQGRQSPELRTDVPHEDRRTDSGADLRDGGRARRRTQPASASRKTTARNATPKPSCARAKQRFRGAFENAPIGMLLTDTDGYVFQANNFALESARLSGSRDRRQPHQPPRAADRTAEPQGNVRPPAASLRQRFALRTPDAVQGQHRDLDQLPRRAAARPRPANRSTSSCRSPTSPR